jgi:putative hydrolase of the HAD superfamily
LLGIITDTANTVRVKLKWFEQGGFGHVWDSIISSKEIGLEKPDPGMYQAALDQLGITANQAVFVGHRKTELDGAKALGIKTIAFNHDPDATADLYVKDFNELIDAPKKLNFDRS